MMMVFCLINLSLIFVDFIFGKASQVEHIGDLISNFVSAAVSLAVFFYLKSESVINEFKKN